MNERIKKVRKSLDLTQREFAERIGMKQNSIALIESGRNTSDQTIFAICREFGVNEEWLRYGTGEMFEKEASDELEALAKKYNLSHGAYIVIEKFVKMNEADRQVLLDYYMEIAAALAMDNVSTEAPAPSSGSEMSIDEKVEDYRRQLELEEKAKEKSLALREDA